MSFYLGVRRIKNDRDTRYEASLGRGKDSRCLGFFKTPEQAAREYNKHAAPLGLELNTDIAPTFKRVRTADGELLMLCVCGQCGQSKAFGKTGSVLCCGRQYAAPADVEALPVEQSQKFSQTVRRVRRAVDRAMREEAKDRFSRKLILPTVD